MRVVSLVPSWTETLLHSGVEIIGRTRFCIHPSLVVQDIPVVGGTKEVDWDLIRDLKPDLIIMDKEENPIALAEECPFPYLATRVTSLQTLHDELVRLGEHFKNHILIELAIQCYDIIQAPTPTWNHHNVPGFIEWVRRPEFREGPVAYVIWKKPWMAVSKATFIGSVLEKLGAALVDFTVDEKYPVLELEELKNIMVLFSTEPYPFHKKISDLTELSLTGAVVNGEGFSWFGKRSLDFLTQALIKSSSQ